MSDVSHLPPVRSPGSAPADIDLDRPAQEPLDLREFYRAMGYQSTDTATAGRYRRLAPQLEPGPRSICSAPLPVTAMLDGVQASSVITRRDHRDVVLAYVAAGAVNPDGILTSLSEQLTCVCSHLDAPKVRAAEPRLIVAALDEHYPWELATATADWIDQARRGAERAALDAAPACPDGSWLLLDGPLPTDSSRRDVAGIVKRACDTDWVSDPALIPEQAGHRSPALLLPGRRRGEHDRMTAYVRLRTATPEQPWSYSLIRVEVYAEAGIEVLDAVAARAMAERQAPTSRDPRWQTHIQAIAFAEKVLKARIPHPLSF